MFFFKKNSLRKCYLRDIRFRSRERVWTLLLKIGQFTTFLLLSCASVYFIAVTKEKRSIGSNWSFDVDIYIGDSISLWLLHTWAKALQSYSHLDLNVVTAQRRQQLKIIVTTMFIQNCTLYGPLPIARPLLKCRHQQTLVQPVVIGTLKGVMATFIHPILRPLLAKCMQTT